MSFATLRTPSSTRSDYSDRHEAGKALGQMLAGLAIPNPVVLALPRGGVVTGYEVARTLAVPLGAVFVRKIGHPLAPETGIAAIAEDDHTVYGEGMQQFIGRRWLRDEEVEARHAIELQKRSYFHSKPAHVNLTGRNVIVVDDGVATGLSMKAAVLYVRRQRPATILVAAPIMSRESTSELEHIVDGVISLCDPHDFRGSVGAHYARFEQLTDREVVRLLAGASVADVHHSEEQT